MLSDLSPELKIELDVQKTITGGLRPYLRLEEQVSFYLPNHIILMIDFCFRSKKEPGFSVEDFSRTHGLLKFSFVRHPFDRYALTGYLLHDNMFL